MQFDEDNLEPAFALLARGMPDRSRRFWETGIRRIVDAGHNRALRVPLGHYLLDRGRPVGVMLTIAAPIDPPRPAADTQPAATATRPRAVVNLSSWTIEPEFRWRAPLMLRTLTGDPTVTYKSLTPIPSVARLLQACGFVAQNRGLSVLPTLHPVAARRGDGPVADLAALTPDAEADLGSDRLVRMRAHAALGCLAIAFRDGVRWQPLILRPQRTRGLPAVRLLHCESLGALDRQIGPVLRHLLGRGRLLLVMDVPPDARGRGLVRRAGIGFRKGPAAPDAIDHGYSELVYLDL